ncbi:thiamine pyrophosphate-requiring protein [Consotaella salsifontis]|uniref:Pyruvate dehydrogenase (Quinone) n=1 Tax=Consotaella salsifontis TaxID=1365950 RepID=A0A1T4TFG0_9HYPH|nr:thiamine pyrophosphate-requiring protein [Consotaella salsifontis]SKA39180.1 pyruvate dehydrogenase (quinone) [Consotaella salsifontis]
MAKTVGDFILERMKGWGVKRVFGYPGDGIGGLVAAVGRDDGEDAIDFIQTRHEESAAFMACAHAKFTGEPGVCVATSGPGAIHLLNGLYDAKLDHQPVVAIVGQQARAAIGGNYQQEVDLQALFKDVASDFVETCMSPTQVRHLIDRAFRIAKSRKTVTCVILPNDVQEAKAVEEAPHAHGTVHTSQAYTPAEVVPAAADLQRAAEVLNAGKKVGILIGAGALGAANEVTEVANVLGAGVAKALLGKAALPDGLPFVTGSIGLLGTEPSDWMMQHCDTFLMIGSRFPYSEFLPKTDQARGVQIDLDPTMLSIRFPMEVALTGDSASTLRALLPLLKKKGDRGWREDIEKRIARWWKEEEERAMKDADPVNPERVFWECSSRLPDNAIITADSGSSANWYARALKFKPGMMGSLSGTLATMCPGMPYAVSAKFAYPDRVPIAFVGDGAMQMLGITDLITVSKYWRRWQDPRLVVCVLSNRDLNQVSWELRAMANSPKVPETQDVPAFSFSGYAEMLGLKGIRVDRPEQVASAWDAALAADRPCVIDAIVDPDVASLPPHITISQATSYAEAMLKGDPDEGGVIKQTIKRVFS